jgi:hypothetical protein
MATALSKVRLDAVAARLTGTQSIPVSVPRSFDDPE